MTESQDTKKTKDLNTIKKSKLQQFDKKSSSLKTKIKDNQNLKINFEFADEIDLFNKKSLGK